MVQKAIEKREESGAMLTKIGSMIRTKRQQDGKLRIPMPKIEVTMEETSNQPMMIDSPN